MKRRNPWPMRSLRFSRAFAAFAAVLNAVLCVRSLSLGHFVLAAAGAAILIPLAAAMFITTVMINGRKAQARRPDYAAIARMEREIWGG